jgi:pimeloyl-ACP methyl ester carboxylesterase
LVFVHGWLLSRHYWQPLIECLSPSYQCLSYDLRGFGESGLTESAALNAARETNIFGVDGAISTMPLPQVRSPQYTLAAYAQDLVQLLQQLKISQAWLVGHSLGGSIALWAATLAPQRIEGIVCLNSGGGIYLKEAFERFRSAGQQMLGFRPSWLAHLPFVDIAFSRLMVAQPLARYWGKQRVIDFVKAHPEAALRLLLNSTLPEEVHRLPQVVAQLRQPVYFLAGQQDRVMELKYIYHLASFHHSFHQGQQSVIEIPECGHMGMLEQTSVTCAHIRSILDRRAGESALKSPWMNTAVATIETAGPIE